MKTATLMIIGLLILTTACTTAPEKTETKDVTKYFLIGKQTEKNDLPKIHHVKLMEAKYDSDNRDLERFFPSTLKVKSGDTVRISMLTEEANTISINGDGYGMKAGSFEFTPTRTGAYTIICEDCEDNPTALIRVV